MVPWKYIIAVFVILPNYIFCVNETVSFIAGTAFIADVYGQTPDKQSVQFRDAGGVMCNGIGKGTDCSADMVKNSKICVSALAWIIPPVRKEYYFNVLSDSIPGKITVWGAAADPKYNIDTPDALQYDHSYGGVGDSCEHY